MNKTFTINLANQIFNINDDAYETLLAYFSSLEKFYANEEGKEDIITDIKARFAELFFEKGKNYIITKEDAEQVINTMGKPQEFDEEKVEQEQQTTQNYSSTSTKTGDAGKSGKRLYRDTDEPIVAGVASGLSAYFGIQDPIWIRALFIISPFITFGTALLAYIILWIVMPEAQTSAQKLEMKGEPINLSNIEKTIKDETDKVQQNLKNNKGALAQIISFLGMLIKMFFKFLLGVGVFILAVFGIIILFVLLILGLTMIFAGPIFASGIFDAQVYTWIISIGGVLVTIIPLILIILGIVHLISTTSKPFKKSIVFPLFGLLMLGLLLLNISHRNWINNVQESKTITQHVPINYSTGLDTIELAMAYTDKSPNAFNIKINSFSDYVNLFSKKREIYVDVNIEIYPSNSDSITILKEFSAQGKDEKEALINATSITQSISQINNKFIIDPLLEFNSAKNKLRNQKLTIKIFVPEGKVIKWNEKVEEYMDEDKLPFNWNVSENVVKNQSTKLQQLELKLKSLGDSTTIKLNIDSNNPDIQEAIDDAKQAIEDAQQEVNDKSNDVEYNFFSHEHYIFRMVNGELIALD